MKQHDAMCNYKACTLKEQEIDMNMYPECWNKWKVYTSREQKMITDRSFGANEADTEEKNKKNLK